jgi:OOP family OmpA-OmpF porin
MDDIMKKIVKFISLSIIPLVCMQVTFAKTHHSMSSDTNTNSTYNYKDQPVVIVPGFTPSWYVGGHLGESRVHDGASPGSSNSVTEIGPGWTVDLGYKFIEFYKAIFAGEIGYTQYYHSSETAPGLVIATTDHFSSYAALVGQYPLIQHFGALGKLGVAYSYAQKVFEATGVSASANDYSLYYGGGLTYDITPQAALVLQWARARGNDETGSTDLTSLGISYSFI